MTKTKPKFDRTYVIFATLAVAAVGCSSSDSATASKPTLDAALQEIIQTNCAEVQKCDASGFATAFPAGMSSCVSQLLKSAEDSAVADGRSVGAQAHCTEAQVQTSISDMNARSCADILSSTSTSPVSCKGFC